MDAARTLNVVLALLVLLLVLVPSVVALVRAEDPSVRRNAKVMVVVGTLGFFFHLTLAGLLA